MNKVESRYFTNLSNRKSQSNW